MGRIIDRIRKLENHAKIINAADPLSEMDPDQIKGLIELSKAELSSLKELMKKCKQVAHPLGELTDGEEPSGLGLTQLPQLRGYF